MPAVTRVEWKVKELLNSCNWGRRERVCLSVVSVKVLAKGSSLSPVETYELLNSGSEVTLSSKIARKDWCKWHKAGIYFIRDDRLDSSKE